MSDCPSCPLQNTPYDAQLVAKKARLERALVAHPELDGVEVAALLASARQSGYRNRARMVVDSTASHAQALLGFYEESGREVVAVQSCAAHHSQIEFALATLRPLLFADERLRKFSQFVDVRCTAGRPAHDGEEAVMITLAGAESKPAELEAVEASARELFEKLETRMEGLKISLHLNISEDQNQSVLSGEQREIGGEAWINFGLKIGEDGDEASATNTCELAVGPSAFFQVNLEQLEAVYPRIQPGLAPNGVLVDLYCGVGTHAIALAALMDGQAAEEAGFSDILGFDISESAIEQANKNAEKAGLRAQFLAADDHDAVAWIRERVAAVSKAADSKDVADAPVSVITNPARAGMSAQAVASVAEIGAQAVFYLSCEPETLARDLDRLQDQGFEVERVEAFDFMPQTDQVETLAVLKRSEDAATQPSYERAYQPLEGRSFSPGVSGPSGLSDEVEESVWIALVAGKVPNQGFLPFDRSKKARADKKKGIEQQQIKVERLRKVEGNSVVRIHADTLDDAQIRRRFRAWHHPVLGDPDYGDRNANHLAERHSHLDRLALHCVGAKVDQAWLKAPVPGQFLAMMRLPRTILEEVGE